MIERQKVLEKGAIIVDYREKEITDILKKLGARIIETNLKIGDFICCNGFLCIERKSYNDFVSSIIDGRLFKQVLKMKRAFPKVLLLVEIGKTKRNFNENAFYAALATLYLQFEIPIIYSKSKEETAKLILWLNKKYKSKGNFSSFSFIKKPKNLDEIKEKILASFPSINLKLAKRLLKKFGSLEKVFQARTFQLEKVKGIGEKTSKLFKKILTEKYRG